MSAQDEVTRKQVAEEIQSSPTGEALNRWEWVERSVWTDRMLQALEHGVKGGRWHSLIDKVYKELNLLSSYEKVRKNKGSAGVDHQSVTGFGNNLAEEIAKLQESLKSGTYTPQSIRRVYIPKAGSNKKRALGIPTVRDRVVQGALLQVIEPIFEEIFASQSYGFRPNRGCKDALRRADELMRSGYWWIVDIDFEKYFDTIDHEKLLKLIKEKISDGGIISLIKKFLGQEILEEMSNWKPERGTPQGAVISPLLSNIYLNPLDHLMTEEGFEMVRYADDAVVLCRSEDDARAAYAVLVKWTEQAGLRLHPEKTKIVNLSNREGLDFLGYHFEVSKKYPSRINRWPRNNARISLRNRLRPLTKRTNGNSMEAIIHRINPILMGWYEFFKQSHRFTFPEADGWVRMRLRSILRKRMKRKGIGNGWDNQRWPNAYFSKQGLFSMAEAHVLNLQSSLR